MDPAVILAYAMWDAENTDRLGEHPEAQERYIHAARNILYMVRTYRPAAEREFLADHIRNEPTALELGAALRKLEKV